MTNSLSLRQCHLPGQSSFLFSKCFSRFPQSLKDQTDTFFIPAHGITIPQYPHIANSGLPSSLFALHFLTRFQWARARPRATPTNPHVKYKCVPVLILQYLCFPSEQFLNTKKKRLVSDLQDLKRSARST